MQLVDRYNLQPGKAAAYLEWLKKNDQVFRGEAPPGWTYIGTWFTVQALGSHGVESRWELDDYAALGAGPGTADFGKVMDEWEDYADASSQERSLMKSEDDIRIV